MLDRRIAPTAVTVTAVAVLVLTVPGCSVVVDGVRGSGEVETEDRVLDTFTSVVATGRGEVRITRGEVQSVTVTAEDNLLPLLETNVRGGVLTLRVEDGTVIRPTEPILFEITVAELGRVENSGSGDMTVDGWRAVDAEVSSSGSGDVAVADLTVDSLSAATSGSGDVVISGTTTSQRAETTGSGDYRACGLDSEDAEITTSGSGEAVVTVTGRLVATSSGSGSILYAGDPDEVSEDSSGSGDVEAVDDCPE